MSTFYFSFLLNDLDMGVARGHCLRKCFIVFCVVYYRQISYANAIVKVSLYRYNFDQHASYGRLFYSIMFDAFQIEYLAVRMALEAILSHLKHSKAYR